MKINEILEAIRTQYITLYQERLTTYREEFDPSGPEVLLELDRDVPYVYRLYRIDLASGAVDPPDLTEVNPKTHVDFELIRVEIDGVTVEISPFVWNGAEFHVEPTLQDNTKLAEWAERWIDVGERMEKDEYGLGQFIHSITYPESDEGGISFSVDFGSAPTASWWQLIDTLKQMGASRVRVHSDTMLSE